MLTSDFFDLLTVARIVANQADSSAKSHRNSHFGLGDRVHVR